jgi:arylsulfatase A
MGYGDFSLHGNPHVETPAIDRFARSGIQFDRFFVSPLCAPTRASLLTGRWWPRCGVWGVTHGKETMRADEVTLAEAFRSAGYRTGCFGKWHNGEQYPYTPTGQGFDEFLGFHNGHWNQYFDAELLRGATPEKTHGYITDVLTDAALQFISANRQRPFFCYVPYNAPHSPCEVPDRYFNKYKAQGLDDELACIYGMCQNIDDNFARLLARLDELRLRENTMVLFLTDNGAGTQRYNAGMKGYKGSVDEGGSRVPLFVQWPAKFRAPRIISQIAAHIDLYPTLLDLCEITPPPGPKIDGLSLRRQLQGAVDAGPDRLLFSYNVRGNQEPQMFPGAVRSQQYRLVNTGRGYELYDMRADPGQGENIAAKHPDVVARLSKAYESWYRDVSLSGFRRFPIPIGYAQENPVELHAPQSYFDAPLGFFAGPGFANDWLTHWTDAKAKIWFEIDPIAAGKYAVELRYLCPADDAGSTVRISAGPSSVEGLVRGTPIRDIDLKLRVQSEKSPYVSRAWATLELGTLTLAPGPQRLVIEAAGMPGRQVLDLKGVVLRRLDVEESK